MTIRPLALLLAVALGGCAAVKGAEQPVTLRLSPAPPPGVQPLSETPLAVAPVQARGLAGSLRYDYIDASAPSEIRQAKTLFWEEPPTRVLERALVEGLRTRFATVTGAMLASTGVRRVIVELNRFEETGAGGSARATVAFDVTVTETPVRMGRYCGGSPIHDPSGTSRAQAFEAAITASVNMLAQDLAQGALTHGDC